MSGANSLVGNAHLHSRSVQLLGLFAVYAAGKAHLPKPQDAEGGVSSSGGQPDSESIFSDSAKLTADD